MRSGVNREVSRFVGWGGGDCVVSAGKGGTRGEEKHGQADSEERYWSSISDRVKSVGSGEERAFSAPMSASSFPIIPI